MFNIPLANVMSSVKLVMFMIHK